MSTPGSSPRACFSGSCTTYFQANTGCSSSATRVSRPAEYFAELVDQRRRRRVDQLARPLMKAGSRARSLSGIESEVERVFAFDI